MWANLILFVLMCVGFLMMFVILLQRGRGGGLAGAFGGMGGQSAFGTKAGDVFTKITVALAVVWVILAGASGFVLRAEANRLFPGGDKAVPTSPEVGAAEKAGDEDGAVPKLPLAPEKEKPTNAEQPDVENPEGTKPAGGNPEAGSPAAKPDSTPKPEKPSKPPVKDEPGPDDSKPETKPESKPEN